jgi:mitosis inhibitor protein kinase SWE1
MSLPPSAQPIAHATGEMPLKRPAYNRHNPYGHHYRPSPRPSFGVPQRPLTEHERPGKFEVDFVTVDNLGTGEFGNALKVRYKHGNAKDVFAIKKSKRFEGVKHR